MEQIKSCQGRWSIGLCACTDETVHFSYGNATLHILVSDLKNLGIAMQRVAEELKSTQTEGNNAKNKKGLLQ